MERIKRSRFGFKLEVADHIHMCVSVPPRYSIAMAIGFLKGKSAIPIHRELMGHEKNFTGLHFWARGYCVSTVGLNEEEVRKYIREQEEADKKQGELEFK
jgi:putative transposase